MKTIKYTCSLGSLCTASDLLKRNNRKYCSYPFDWIFSDCEMIMDCLNNDFEVFLNKSFYMEIKDASNDNQCGHSIYNPNLFQHRDPRNEKDYKYYVRCVNRFQELLRQPEHKLFVMININQQEHNDSFRQKIVAFNNSFSKHTCNYTLLFIYHIPNKEQQFHQFTYHDNIHILELHTYSFCHAYFPDDRDTQYLDTIFTTTYTFF